MMAKLTREQAIEILEETRSWEEFADQGGILATTPALIKFNGHSTVEVDYEAVEAFAKEVAIRSLIEVCDGLKGWSSLDVGDCQLYDGPSWQISLKKIEAA